MKCLLVMLVLAPALLAQVATVAPLYTIPDGVETRWASPENPAGEKGVAAQENGGRKGRPSVPVAAGQSITLAEVRGRSGTVRRIWITISDRSPQMLRGLRIDMFWDGASKAAVSAPLGDFFGIGVGATATFESALFASPEGRSFLCFAPMPFRTGMRITVTNESGKDLAALYYDVDYTLGDRHGPEVLYFHAHYRRENPTRLQQDYEILPRVEGRGRFLGANLGVIANQKLYAKSWWGEGEVKMFIDGDFTFPTLSGTGTEDYIGTGWGQGKYAGLYQGCPVADQDGMRYAFYRYHIPDPVYFHRSFRATIQQIGWNDAKTGTMKKINQPIYMAGPGLVEMAQPPQGLFERRDDWSSCAYFYLDKPENALPLLDPAEKRIEGL